MFKAIRIRTSFLVPLFCIAVLFCGCQKKAGDEIDFGTINNSVYQNNYFGLTVPLPADWTVQDQKEQQQLVKDGGQMLYGDDKNKQAVLRAAQLQTVHLFAVFKYPLGSPVPFNPSIISMAENVQELPGIKRGNDYLYHVKKNLDAGQIEVTYPADNYSTNLAGVDFDVMQTQMTMNGITISQKYYVTIMKGYALTFIITYNTDSAEASLQKIMGAVAFK
jgi:hypothetical protein